MSVAAGFTGITRRRVGASCRDKGAHECGQVRVSRLAGANRPPNDARRDVAEGRRDDERLHGSVVAAVLGLVEQASERIVIGVAARGDQERRLGEEPI